MSLSTAVLVFVSLVYVFVECEITNLNVRKFNRQMVAKKRQDTLDMCRIFTEENSKIQHSKPKIIESYKFIRRAQNKMNKKDGNTHHPEPDFKDIAGLRSVTFGLKTQKGRKHKREVDVKTDVIEDSIYKMNENRKKRDVNTEIPINSAFNAAHERFKRAATKNPVNPALSPEDEKKIESIVDKMYNDLEEKGEKIPYRRNPMLTSTTTAPASTAPKNVTNTSKRSSRRPSRRLFFAPAILKGPGRGKQDPEQAGVNKTSVYDHARWKHGIIPYFIDCKTYDAQLQETIMKAFDYIEKATCIRLQKLRERPTDKKSLQEVDWVYITNPAGVKQCVHSNEKRKIDGVQMSVLGYECMSLGDIVHEVMHILGFSHEHTRPDRDQYISILWDNIKPGYKKYFEISKAAEQYTLENLPYDYASILHYPPRAFSKNGQMTIHTDPGIKIGQREGLSEIDLEKIGTIYSSECVERNKDYLLKTCPSVVKSEPQSPNVTQQEIEDYFKDRLWEYGLITYKLRDQMEFSTEEKENIKAVIDHIEKETCIQFRDMAVEEKNDEDDPEENNVADESDESAYHPNVTPDPNYVHPLNSEKEPDYKELQDLAGDNLNNTLDDPKPEAENPTVEGEPEVPKAEDPKVEEPKVEEPKLEEPKVEEPKVEEPKVEEPKIEEPKIEEPKIEEPKVEEANVEATDIPAPSDAKPVKRQAERVIKQTKRIKREAYKSPRNPGRRHAANILVLARSSLPGCKCPKPGKPKGNMVLEINADCFNSVNDLLHLFVHVLGLDHQHNMHDRDKYLHIMWKNLSPDVKEDLGKKLPPAASVGFPYDYQSVMHYPWLQIKNGVTNMMYPIWNDGWAMGHWQGLSSFDVQKLNLLYFSQCSERQKQSQH